MATSTRSARARGGPRPRRPTPTAEEAPLGAPLLLVNLKSYPKSVAHGAERIGLLLETLSRSRGVAAAIAPAPMDVSRLVETLRIPVVAQHVDPLDAGPQTGFFVPEALFLAGGRGSLVNHSEHRLAPMVVRATVERLTALGLVAVVCARDVDEARSLARLHPPYLAIEPPELIGGDRAVSTANPGIVSGTVEAVRKISPRTLVLCGAGVHDRADVRAALALGSVGILVASAVATAVDPRAAIDELLEGFPARP